VDHLVPVSGAKPCAKLDRNVAKKWRASTADAAEDQRRKCDEIEINLCTSSQTVAGDIADYHSFFLDVGGFTSPQGPPNALPAIKP
jgi:hypothetical protein